MPQHVVVTGGAGFIGRAIVERIVARGDRVTALVRDPARATHLGEAVELVRSDLGAAASLEAVFRGADVVVHGAGSYAVGIPVAQHPAMWDANVGTTERVLDAAIAAGVPRIVYLSTINVLGNTNGRIVDETYRRNVDAGFLSYYDETKYRAHEIAEARIAKGAPILIAMPGQVYGPHDHSLASEQLALAHAGKLRFLAVPDLGCAWVHVHDLADGLVAAVDRGHLSGSYSFAGDMWRMDRSVAMAAQIGGHRPPIIRVPNVLLRLVAPLNDRVGGLPLMPKNLAEALSAGAGVTYWMNHDKASRELGFVARSLEQGIADTWGRA